MRLSVIRMWNSGGEYLKEKRKEEIFMINRKKIIHESYVPWMIYNASYCIEYDDWNRKSVY